MAESDKSLRSGSLSPEESLNRTLMKKSKIRARGYAIGIITGRRSMRMYNSYPAPPWKQGRVAPSVSDFDFHFGTLFLLPITPPSDEHIFNNYAKKEGNGREGSINLLYFVLRN